MENNNVAGDIDTVGEAVTEMAHAAHDINYWSGLLFQVSNRYDTIKSWSLIFVLLPEIIFCI